jgi:DNA polymerase III delta prime subunit
MDTIKLNTILDRTDKEVYLKNKLIELEKNKNDLTYTRGFYVYGNPGVGKTEFVKNVLKELNYDIICYDSSDSRNKNIIEKITKNNMSDRNVLSLFYKNPKKIAIIIDEIDGMNNGDKASITSLIKLIRAKKTKKQKTEDSTMTPVICIGNSHIDKKIGELMKACICIELFQPNKTQIYTILKELFIGLSDTIIKNICGFIDGDLRKIKSAYELYEKQQCFFKKELLQNIFQSKTLNEDTKQITKQLLNHDYNYEEHNLLINETDRTSIALLYHENIIDVIQDKNKEKSILFYLDLLNTFTYSDYIDRITFQKQIWVFNEVTSLMKTFRNNHSYHSHFPNNKKYDKDIRFTKILTKYSTEYNNMLFIQNLCNILNMDKKDLLSFFIHLRNTCENEEAIINILSNYDITKLDIQRMYRFIDKYTCIYENDDI